MTLLIGLGKTYERYRQVEEIAVFLSPLLAGVALFSLVNSLINSQPVEHAYLNIVSLAAYYLLFLTYLRTEWQEAAILTLAIFILAVPVGYAGLAFLRLASLITGSSLEIAEIVSPSVVNIISQAHCWRPPPRSAPGFPRLF